MEAITLTESKRLKELEIVIEEGQSQWLQVGLALTEIRDGKLYRAEFDTFKAYCVETWGWTDKRAYQLIDASSESSTSGRTFATEREARKAKLERTAKSRSASPAPSDDEEPPHIRTADDEFRDAMGLPDGENIKTELEQIHDQLAAIERHILDSDLTGEDYCLLAKEIFRLSERVSRIGKSKKVEEKK